MAAKIIDGNMLSKTIQSEIAEAIRERSSRGLRAPGLAVVIVGDNQASRVYVNKKRRICQELGILARDYDLEESTSEQELLSLVNELNHDNEIDGILIQLPLPKHINGDKIIESIHPLKDVDGFHPYNIGRLSIGQPTLRPCTPSGIMELIKSTAIALKGLNAVIIGASNIVGKPMAMELINTRATVTVCRSTTKNLPAVAQTADILVVATGVAEMVKGSWIKPGSLVIDVGISRLPQGKLVGDVDFEQAKEVAGWITPVPGGVGPMTVAMLMKNTLHATMLSRS